MWGLMRKFGDSPFIYLFFFLLSIKGTKRIAAPLQKKIKKRKMSRK